jgi:hypothetical protein
MNWYLIKIVFRIICGDGHHTAQFDEQLRIIFAENKIAALEKGHALGKQEGEVFLNNKQQPVQWKFINVTEIYKLGVLMDGAELYSCIKETDDVISYMDMVNHKANSILHSNTHELLQLV